MFENLFLITGLYYCRFKNEILRSTFVSSIASKMEAKQCTNVIVFICVLHLFQEISFDFWSKVLFIGSFPPPTPQKN